MYKESSKEFKESVEFTESGNSHQIKDYHSSLVSSQALSPLLLLVVPGWGKGNGAKFSHSAFYN